MNATQRKLALALGISPVAIVRAGRDGPKLIADACLQVAATTLFALNPEATVIQMHREEGRLKVVLGTPRPEEGEEWKEGKPSDA